MKSPPWRYRANLLGVGLVAFILALSLITTGFAYQQAEAYVHPLRLPAPTGKLLAQNGIQYQEVELVTADGIRLAAWYTPPENNAVILVAHGYGAVRPEEFYVLFASQGYGVLAWDFRGHGESDGQLVTLGYYESLDVEAALDFVLRQAGVEHIGAWGGSMGAVAVIRAAARRPEIEAVVADSPFVTLEDELNLRVPYAGLNSLIRFFAEQETGIHLDQVRPVDDIARLSPRPVFLIQGLGDNIIPANSAERLYNAAGEPRQLWTEKDVPHLCMYAYQPEGYTRQVLGFFSTYLLH